MCDELDIDETLDMLLEDSQDIPQLVNDTQDPSLVPVPHGMNTLPVPKHGMNLAQVKGYCDGIVYAMGEWMLVNEVTLVGGVSGVGKSTLVQWLMKGYCEDIWIPGFPVPDELKGGKIVVYLAEGFIAQLNIHLEAWKMYERYADRIILCALKDDKYYLPQFPLDKEGWPEFEMTLKEHKPRLVIIDGLSSAVIGDENSSSTFKTFFMKLNNLARRYSAAIIVTHHLHKRTQEKSFAGETPSINWFRGTGTQVHWSRSAWILDRPDKDNMNTRRITLVKASLGKDGQQIGFIMDDPKDGLSGFTEKDTPTPDGQDAQEAQEPPRKRHRKSGTQQESVEKYILDCLHREQLTADDIKKKALRERTDLKDINRGTWHKAFQKLVKDKTIVEGLDDTYGLPDVEYL